MESVEERTKKLIKSRLFYLQAADVKSFNFVNKYEKNNKTTIVHMQRLKYYQKISTNEENSTISKQEGLMAVTHVSSLPLKNHG
ncbi:hypothetical protein BpHYR1_009075 [Brachionus plicatilis]|uniref:Uncharacterized protein n=1 Tax=Brachionus plicatilis TaxID=10195 RepID=A0A3M7QMS9_BRAPC|nr:hypothetical protein BpHYR1_009075 [Brachionus plicatilis]